MGLSFKNSHARKRDHVLAVDLGVRTTKAVHVQRRGDKLSLLNYAIIETPPQEKALLPDTLAETLRELSRVLGGRAKQVTLALSVGDTVFRQVELPLMPVTDLRQMLKFNSKNYLQQELPDHVFDCCYTLNGRSSKPADAGKPNAAPKHKVMVGAAKRQMIEDLNGAIKAAGLLPDQVVPGLIGPINAFELAEAEAFAGSVVALVEIGFRNTTVAILDGGEIMINRIVAIGGDQITTGLAESLGISNAEAEGIKVGMPSEVQQNLEPVLHPLGRELRASLDFFENQQDKTVSKVFLSGGSARNEVLVQILQNELMVPCEVWNPAKSMQMALPPERVGDIEQVSPQLTVAIGAAASAF